MAKHILNDVTIRNAKPEDKDKRLNDGNGLYLLIKPNGAKWWRLDYTVNLKRKTLSLGVYPTISLADARRKADEAKTSAANGIDPSEKRKSDKAILIQAKEQEKRIEAGLPIINSFEHVCREWLDSHAHGVRGVTLQKKIRRFELYVFPVIGSMPIADVIHVYKDYRYEHSKSHRTNPSRL